MIGNQHEFNYFLYFLKYITCQHVKEYVHTKMLIPMLLRMQKEKHVKVNLIPLELQL